MTMPTSNPSVSSRSQWDDEAIDIRRYLRILVAWWREIVLITILAALAGLGLALYLRSQQVERYTASANVVLAVTSSQINLDPRVQTTINPVLAGPDARNSLLPLVSDGRVVQAVIEELGDQLPTSLQQPSTLVKIVQATFPPTGPNNVVTLSATTTDPDLSVLIVNTWAQKYVTHINQLYGDVPQDTLNNVRVELESAREAFNAAQDELEEFIANNQLDELNRRISQKVAIRNGIANARTAAVASVVDIQNSMEAQAYSILASSPFTKTLSQVEVEQSTAALQLTELRTIQAATQIQLERARTIISQLEAGGDAAARSLTRPLQLLKDQVFGEQPFGLDQPNYLSVIPPEASAETLLTDARTLVTALETYQAEIDQQITDAIGAQALSPDLEALLTTASSPTSAGGEEAGADVNAAVNADVTNYGAALAGAYANLFSIDETTRQLIEQQNQGDATEAVLVQLDGEIRALRAALAAETSRERQLTQERDLTWTAYDALSNRLVELNLSRTSSTSLVRMAGPALVPIYPNPSPSLLIPTAAAAAAGLLGMILFAFLANALDAQPFFSRRRASQRPAQQS